MPRELQMFTASTLTPHPPLVCRLHYAETASGLRSVAPNSGSRLGTEPLRPMNPTATHPTMPVLPTTARARCWRASSPAALTRHALPLVGPHGPLARQHRKEPGVDRLQALQLDEVSVVA